MQNIEGTLMGLKLSPGFRCVNHEVLLVVVPRTCTDIS